MKHAHVWKQTGSLVLWYYTENERNYPGWHLTADTEGCRSLIALLDALANDGEPAMRTFQIKPPTAAHLAVPNNRAGHAAWHAPGKLKLAFSSDPCEWKFPVKQELAVLALGAEPLRAMRNGLEDVLQGRGDYCIDVPHRNCAPLWFWWWPKSAIGRE
ncbi:hypothetical protein [Stenotrophomonas sp. SY1]|uniref:hypothetical protein n=1 Tax=Stenotrophomonas sp. SY1 TaxID=477235 RepID=UPI001E2F1B7B|nr:hypothetical protein [Stenotrophomonas sp. SY1]MCD9087613.1 hypothetical protein [Stenotrophomonas sp. SY1]